MYSILYFSANQHGIVRVGDCNVIGNCHIFGDGVGHSSFMCDVDAVVIGPHLPK